MSVSRRRALAVALALLALLALAGRRLAETGAADPPTGAAAGLTLAAAAPARVVVHVAGAVRRPGLYRLRDGARVADAIARAWGRTVEADLAAVNLAAPLADGSQVVVPALPPPAGADPVEDGGAPSSTERAAPGSRVSLATATEEQLDALPGIGPVTAQKILDYRAANGPFRSVDDLDAVPGIGPARVEQLRDLVTP